MTDLKIHASGRLVVLTLVIAALLFIPAGTLNYWQAWLFLGLYFTSSLATTLYLLRHDQALLQRRMFGGPAAEQQSVQKIIMTIASAAFVGIIVVPALDHRFAWSAMPATLALAGDGLMAVGWIAIFCVFKENTYSSAIIELAPDQTVISTGPYAVVRHPMYAAGFVLLTAIPIALGSWWGLLVIAATLPVLVWRLLDEERFLARNLAGYRTYQTSVPYRLIPHVW